MRGTRASHAKGLLLHRFHLESVRERGGKSAYTTIALAGRNLVLLVRNIKPNNPLCRRVGMGVHTYPNSSDRGYGDPTRRWSRHSVPSVWSITTWVSGLNGHTEAIVPK